MQTTAHYSFNIPESGDFVNISDLTDNWEAADGILNSLYLDLRNTTTTIATVNGNKQITEVDSTNNVTTVTTIEDTSDTVKTITAVITPDAGDVYYTKVTTITTTASGKTITQTVTTSPKED